MKRYASAGLWVGLLAFGLAGCGGPREGLFLGAVTTRSGVCGLSAGPDGIMQGSLSIRRDAVVFAPETGVLSLSGSMDKAGHINAGQTLAGADKKPFPLAFEGDLVGDAVTGVYATPRCRAEVTLRRQD